MQDFRSSVQDAKSQATAAAVNKLTTPLNRVSTGLGTVSGDLTAFGQRIDTEQAALVALTSRVLTAITLAAVAADPGLPLDGVCAARPLRTRVRPFHRPRPAGALAQREATGDRSAQLRRPPAGLPERRPHLSSQIGQQRAA